MWKKKLPIKKSITLFLCSLAMGDLAFAQSAKKTFTNSSGITFIQVSPGEFTMGSPTSEEGRSDDEEQVKVQITQSYWLAETELTQEQWEQVMDISLQELVTTKIGALGRGAKLKNKPSVVAPDHPMCFVSYTDASAFCKTLTEKEKKAGTLPEGYIYDLPTEAQWEYAARAGSTATFGLGDSLTSKDANFYGILPYNSNEKGEYREKTTAVKSFKPNAWGFYDMHGNLYEWCKDWYVEKLPGGENPVNLDSGESRSIRGGAWNRKATSCRSAYRYSYDPTQRTNNIGFRVALVPVTK